MVSSVSPTSSASSGQSILTALNASNGMDMTSLATNLAAAEKISQQSILDSKKIKLEGQVSSIGKIMSTVDGFATALADLGDPNSFSRLPQSSDVSKVSVEFLNNTTARDFSSSVNVVSIATESSIRLSPVTDIDATLLNGSSAAKYFILKDNQGATLASFDLTSVNTLSKLQDAVNNVSGFSASIIQGGTSASPKYYLSIKHGLGTDNRFSATMTDISGSSVIDDLIKSSLGYVQNQGNDAEITVDGVSITSGDGIFKNVIPGVSLTAKSVTGGTNIIVSSQVNTEALTNAISTLISGFNTMVQAITAETAFNEDPKKRGGLSGDANARSLLTDLRRFTTQPIKGYDEKIRTFSELGISTNRDGTLALDTKVFALKLKFDPAGVEAVLGSKRYLADNRMKFVQTSTKTEPGVYTIKKSDNDSWTINDQDTKFNLGMLMANETSSAQGLSVLIPNDVNAGISVGYSTKFYFSRGLVERFSDMLANVKSEQSSLQIRNANANSALKNIDLEQTKLDDKEKSAKQRYITQFTALQSLLSSNKEKANNLTNFMTSWSASLKN